MSQFENTAEDLEFLKQLYPQIDGETFQLPAPTHSPQLRRRLRLSFRNERRLYTRKCDLDGESIVSNYSPDKPYAVYSKKNWWSDKWDALEYGRDFDFTRPFFEQFAELQSVVPRLALVSGPDSDDNNCRYINFAGDSKNCYMIFDSDFNEDCLYSNVLKHSRNCIDCSYVHSSELCYECIDCNNCYRLLYSQDCTNCNDSYFLNNCIGCSDCLFCCNLVRKQYYIRNKAYSKADYEAQLRKMGLADRHKLSQLRAEFAAFVKTYPKKFCHILKAENCVGDFILNAKNCFNCFNISEGEELRHCDSLYSARYCMDVSSFGEKIERVYQSGTIGLDSFNIYFCFACLFSCSDIFYSDNCRSSQNCFGCVSVKQGRYCILNKRYAAADYFRLVKKIVRHMRDTGEWGQHFPIGLSTFGYNETMAQQHFPLTKSEALELGAKWSDFEQPAPTGRVFDSKELPDSPDKITDHMLGGAFKCSLSEKPFRLTTQEVELYRRSKIPPPAIHPDLRYMTRMAQRNPQELWSRICPASGETIWSSYDPSRTEVVLSEGAFLEELEG